jgi:hypothetical protein
MGPLLTCGNEWWAREELDLRPLPCQGSALPLSYAPRCWWSVQGSVCVSKRLVARGDRPLRAAGGVELALQAS